MPPRKKKSVPRKKTVSKTITKTKPARRLGLLEKPSIHKGRKPFFYFRGPIVDAGRRFDIRSVPEERIREVFITLGLKKFPKTAPAELKKELEKKVFEMRKNKEREGLFFLNLGNGKLIPFKITISDKMHEVLVYQQPAIHGIIREDGGNIGSTTSSFGDLKRILAKGFKGVEAPNSEVALNAKGWGPTKDINKGITNGDGYSLEVMKTVKKTSTPTWGKPEYFVTGANPHQILRVNIYVREKRNEETKEEYQRVIEEKKKFYRTQFPNQSLRFLSPSKS